MPYQFNPTPQMGSLQQNAMNQQTYQSPQAGNIAPQVGTGVTPTAYTGYVPPMQQQQQMAPPIPTGQNYNQGNNQGNNQGTVDSNGNPVTPHPTFFQKGGGMSIALGGLQTLGSLWNSFQQTQVAKQSLSMQTKAFNTNLANQTKTYNTALQGRINARYATEGRPQQAAAYIAKRSL